jgi:hypothetical protein
MKRNGFDREMCGDYFQYGRSFYFQSFLRSLPHANLGLLAYLVFDLL